MRAVVVLLALVFAMMAHASAQGRGDGSPRVLVLEADSLLYEGDKGFTARGNVEIKYDSYVLTAATLVFDRRANSIMLIGDVVLRDAAGAITRAEELELPEHMRMPFLENLERFSLWVNKGPAR